MEEAQGLCKRIAIQVDGAFKCIGPITHIKKKYGKGYELEIKINDQIIDEQD